MKACKVCKRVLIKNRWVKDSKKLAKAELMNSVEWVVCEDCARSSGTYEAIIQPRGISKEKVEEIINKEMEKSKERGEFERVFEKNGDYYFTSKKIARAVAKKLKEMGAELIFSSKVKKFDRERSIPITTLTISARFEILPYDVVEHKGKLFLVEKVSNGWIFTKEGKKIKVREAKPVGKEEMEGIVVSRKPPFVFLRETKETIEVKDLPNKSEVKVIRAKNKIWVV